jgi:catechol 2,3-dioxygenase-like lactoylglutathione lyase family enzyme
MPPVHAHHAALRVKDLERSVRFYVDALDAAVLTAPIEQRGRFIQTVFGASEPLHVRMCLLGFETGGLELWQFLEPQRELPPSDQPAVGLMHFALEVGDVSDTLRRVQAAGGRARCPVSRIGGTVDDFVYCEDLDGHVFELLEAPLSVIAASIIALMPEAAPVPRSEVP